MLKEKLIGLKKELMKLIKVRFGVVCLGKYVPYISTIKAQLNAEKKKQKKEGAKDERKNIQGR